ncbi:hypothetical protein Anapl_14635 [Anas platyrhynchos]|uniref:Uncharacterized protein n=1 Tax=Anas platyrhynchos TaxID=8839 RepID=R0KZU7_ANAPL|nr:hypothetical protein Anapl_14635 [Anas platyrhynchos]
MCWANGSRSYSLSVIKSRFDGSFLDVATAGSTRTARASALCTPDIAEGSAKGSFSRLDFLSNEMPSVAKSHIKNLPLGGICLIIAMAFKKEQSLQPNGECGIRMRHGIVSSSAALSMQGSEMKCMCISERSVSCGSKGTALLKSLLWRIRYSLPSAVSLIRFASPNCSAVLSRDEQADLQSMRKLSTL